MNNLPRVTVITVVYNGRAAIARTIASVAEQIYPNLEYIVIDGASTDGTLDVIRAHEEKITQWESEKDSGIYNAMNRGIALATGEWINFMNCGDVFANKDVITTLFGPKESAFPDVIYGDVRVNYGQFSRVVKAKDLVNFSKGMPFCHQTVFVRTQLMREHHFDEKYRLAADFDFFYGLWKKQHDFFYFPGTIAIISNEGVSDTARKKVVDEYQDIVLSKEVGQQKIRWRIYFQCYKFKVNATMLIKKILGGSLTAAIQKRKAKAGG
ncbi:MAG: glycosyltransferase family 2 protein [Agriterribacter sp.]